MKRYFLWRTIAYVFSAICAEIDFVDGDPVTSAMNAPQENTDFNLRELYAPGADDGTKH